MVPAAVVFLLFIAVLAFAWFYVQRAKMRDVASTTTTERVDTDGPAPSDRPG